MVRGSVTTPLIGARRRREGAGEERAAALALAALEVAVGRAHGVLPGGELVAVHGEAHRAAGLAPLGTGGLEDLVETLALGLGLHLLGARDDHDPRGLADLPALEDGGSEAQVADAAVRAGADEDDIDRLAGDGLAGLQVHIGEALLEAAAGRVVRHLVEGGDVAVDADAHARVGAVGDHRLELVRVEDDGLVVDGALVGGEGAPVGDGLVPIGARGGVAAAADVVEGGLVGGDETGPRAALDAHVADGHPLLHVERADGLARELEDVAGPATGADPRDEGEDDVLGTHAGLEGAVDADLVGLRLALEQGLGGEDHLDLARPDAERQRAERAVGGRVGVAADDGHAGLRQAELGADDVDDALGVAAVGVDRDAELGAVGLELPDLGGTLLVEDREAAGRGRGAVVRRGDGLARLADPGAPGAEPGEGLGAGDLVDEVEIDGEEGGGAVVLGDDVLVPDLLDEGARCAHAGCCSAAVVRIVKGTSVTGVRQRHRGAASPGRKRHRPGTRRAPFASTTIQASAAPGQGWVPVSAAMASSGWAGNAMRSWRSFWAATARVARVRRTIIS